MVLRDIADVVGICFVKNLIFRNILNVVKTSRRQSRIVSTVVGVLNRGILIPSIRIVRLKKEILSERFGVDEPCVYGISF